MSNLQKPADSRKADGVPNAGVVSTGEVNVLLVSVSVPSLVTMFDGVIMSDKIAMFVSYIMG